MREDEELLHEHVRRRAVRGRGACDMGDSFFFADLVVDDFVFD